MRKRPCFHYPSVVILIIIISLMAYGIFVVRAGDGKEKADLGLMLDIISIIKLDYVDKVNILDLVSEYIKTGTINGMLEALDDPYTKYMEPESFKDMMEETEGVYGGIGIYIGIRNGKLMVVAPIKDTPGERCGLQSEDHIVTIDGRPTTNMSEDEASSLMRGEPGTEVVLGIERGSHRKEMLEFRITREIINTPSISETMLDNDTGYIQIAAFLGSTAKVFEESLNKLIDQGAKGIIIDLRYNGGGLLEQAVNIASMFVEKGPILHVVGRNGNRNTVNALGYPKYDIPLMILINGGSASASEILSGALKDSGRAVLVGTKSFGKGLVQSIIPLSNGGGLVVTTHRYLTAGGFSIHDVGIEPNVVIDFPEGYFEKLAEEEEKSGEAVEFVDLQLDKAREIMMRKILEKDRQDQNEMKEAI